MITLVELWIWIREREREIETANATMLRGCDQFESRLRFQRHFSRFDDGKCCLGELRLIEWDTLRIQVNRLAPSLVEPPKTSRAWSAATGCRSWIPWHVHIRMRGFAHTSKRRRRRNFKSCKLVTSRGWDWEQGREGKKGKSKGRGMSWRWFANCTITAHCGGWGDEVEWRQQRFDSIWCCHLIKNKSSYKQILWQCNTRWHQIRLHPAASAASVASAVAATSNDLLAQIFRGQDAPR